MRQGTGKLAVVTGASSGIGFELAQLASADGYDLIIAADETDIHDAAAKLKATSADVVSIVADLSDEQGVEELNAEIAKREDRSICSSPMQGAASGTVSWTRTMRSGCA